MTSLRRIRWAVIATLVIWLPVGPGRAADHPERRGRYAMTGMVLKVDPPGKRFLVSHESVADVMPAMAMWFDIQNPKELDGLSPGAIVEFVLAVGRTAVHAEHVRIRQYVSDEQDPLTARRLRLLKEVS